MTRDRTLKLLSSNLSREQASWLFNPGRDPVGVELIERLPEELQLRILHRGGEYFLYLDLSGSGRHHCTCRDFKPTLLRRRVPKGRQLFCRHVVAAALKMKRHELLLPLVSGGIDEGS